MIHNSVIIELPGSSSACTESDPPPLQRCAFSSPVFSCWRRSAAATAWRRAGGTERAHRILQRLSFVSDVILTPTTNSQQKVVRRRGAAAEHKNKKNKKKNHGSLSRQVNKPTVGGGQSSASNQQSPKVQESNRQEERNHQNCLGNVSYHFIVFNCIFIIAMEKYNLIQTSSIL